MVSLRGGQCGFEVEDKSSFRQIGYEIEARHANSNAADKALTGSTGKRSKGKVGKESVDKSWGSGEEPHSGAKERIRGKG